MDKPLVTVITPVYNGGRFIQETVESILNQDYGNLQYLLINDGSTDNIREVLKPYLNRIEYVYQPNRGEASAVNNGLKRVSGKYFMIINADDPLLPRAIITLVKFMENHSDVLCAYPCWNTIDEQGKVKQHFDQGEYDFSKMVRHCMCQPSVGSMFRSDVIQKVGLRDLDFRRHSDFDYWLRIGLVGKMARVPETLATFRVHDSQQSSEHSDARAQEFIRIIEKFWTLEPTIPLVDLFCIPIVYRDSVMQVVNLSKCWSYIIAAGITDSKVKTAEYVWEAVKVNPSIFINFEFWDTLVKKAIAILRR